MTTKQAEWKEFIPCSDEHIAEMINAKNGFILRNDSIAEESEILKSGEYPSYSVKGYAEYYEPTHYLICEPHPLADMIIRQAQTGQPVYIKTNIFMEHYGDCCSYMETTTPDWNIPNAEYSFTPFDEPRSEVIDAFNKSINKFDALYKTIKD